MKALGIFATAPIPGQVKRRLTEEAGASTAVEVYSRIGRRVVEAVAGSGVRTIVWFTPPTEGAFVREWLDGVGRVEFRPQGSGSLAARLHQAFMRHFAEGGQRVVLIGTDAPGVDRRLVTEAFAALGSHDLVLGPAVDGGLYLMGLRGPAPGLFQGVAWSGGSAGAQVRARALGLRLSVRLLRPLRDVDTLQDARVLGLLKS